MQEFIKKKFTKLDFVNKFKTVYLLPSQRMLDHSLISVLMSCIFLHILLLTGVYYFSYISGAFILSRSFLILYF